jgi:hypothetical protein
MKRLAQGTKEAVIHYLLMTSVKKMIKEKKEATILNDKNFKKTS